MKQMQLQEQLEGLSSILPGSSSQGGNVNASDATRTCSQPEPEPSQASAVLAHGQIISTTTSSMESSSQNNELANYPNPEGLNWGLTAPPEGENILCIRCRNCCMYKIPSQDEKHTCRPDLIGHKWPQCPTKNFRQHLRERALRSQQTTPQSPNGDPNTCKDNPLLTIFS